MKTITTWHVFGDNWDDWFETIEKARKCYDDYAKENPLANLRMYEEVSEVDGDMVTEDYVIGQNDFPW